jgi:RecB family exonuclease
LSLLARKAAIEKGRLAFFQELGKGVEPGARLPVKGGPFDGVFGQAYPEAPGVLEAFFIHTPDQTPSPVLSITALETLAACPFKFWIEHVLGFKEPEAPGEEMTPADLGTLWHQVLAQFYQGKLRKGQADAIPLAVLVPGLEHQYRQELRTLGKKLMDEASASCFTGHPALWELQQERFLDGLNAWLTFELGLLEETGGFRPAFLELGFGRHPKDLRPLEIPFPSLVSGKRPVLSLTGRIDRLDVKVDGSSGTGPGWLKGLRVVDYKSSASGAHKKAEDVLALRSAQLPLYLAVSCRLAEERGWALAGKALEIEELSAVFYVLKDIPAALHGAKDALLEIEAGTGAKGKRRGKTGPGQETELAWKALLDPGDGPQSLFAKIREMAGRALAGCFPVAPSDCLGAYCPVRYACRYRDFPAEGGGEGEGGDRHGPAS